MSKRNFKRNVSKASKEYKNRLMQVIEEVPQADEIILEAAEISENCEKGAFGDCEEILPQKSLSEKIKEWYLETKPTRRCLHELLKILKGEGLDVPLSAQKLVGKADPVLVKSVQSGIYVHFGIQNQLNKISHILQEYDHIEMDINIDGIPLFKSSRAQLWLILLKIVNVKEKIEAFPAGIYLGKKKPNCVKKFFEEFVDEFIYLKDNYFINENKVILKISMKESSRNTTKNNFWPNKLL